MTPRYAITFDIDWAPDWAIELCIDICRRHGVPCTLFVTHPSAAIDRLRHDEDVELGIHPNFMPNSSHGGTIRGVIEHCMNIVPQAVSLRTHCLYQSTPMFQTLLETAPTIRNDVSLLVPRARGVRAHRLYLAGGFVLRFPYVWEDDVAALDPDWRWDALPAWLREPGIKILNFHPILVALNITFLAAYQDLKRDRAGRPMWETKEAEVRAAARVGGGNQSFLRSLLGSLPREAFATIAQLANIHRDSR